MRRKRRYSGYKLTGWGYLVLLFVFAFIVLYSVWFLFYSSTSCSDWECFNKNLENCKRTNFIGGSRMILEYNILGYDGNSCVVNVKLLQADIRNRDSEKLQGLDMNCEIPMGAIIIPESDLGNCHGRLKEGWQEIVISRLNNYILQNLGKINIDIIDIPLG